MPARLIHPFAALLASAALAAQSPIQATSAGLLAQVGTAAPTLVPPGADVTAGTLRAVTGAPGSASFRVDTATTSGALDVALVVTANATTTGQAQALGELRCELRTPVAVPGVLSATWLPATTGSGAASCRIDLVDDGLDVATSTVSWPLWLGPWPLPIRLRAEAAANAGWLAGAWGTQWHFSGTASGTLLLHFEPTHCTAMPFAPGCGDPQLAVRGNLQGGADLDGTVGPATGLAVAVLGFDPAGAALPLPPHCLLAVAPLATLWALPDAQRRVRFSLPIPPACWPATFRAQLVGFDPVASQATTSAAFLVDCR